MLLMLVIRSTACAALVLAALAIPHVAGAQQPTVPAETGPVAALEPAYDFGSARQGDVVAHRFVVRNDGDVPVAIARIDLTQPGMTIRAGPTIGPGAEGAITVEWDVSRISGDVTADAIVTFADPAQPPVTLSLTGTVVPPIEVSPAPAVFFSLYRDEAADQQVRIVNNQERPLAIEGLRPDGEHFRAELTTIEPGRTYSISILVPSGMPAGRYQEALIVDTDSPERPTIRIGVNVFVKNDLYASPEVVEFGDVQLAQVRNPLLGSLLGQSFIVRKRDSVFRITEVDTDVPGLRVERTPSSAEARDAFRIDIGFDPAAASAGPLDGAIVIRTDDEGFPELTVPVSGTVH
jgi:hypothetical protein